MIKLIAALLGFSLLLITGCSSPVTEFAPAPGFLYANYKAPLLIDHNENSVDNQKGSADTQYFWIPLQYGLDFAWGDCSIGQASENGSINKIGTADYEFFNILGIYSKTSVHVYSAP